MRPTTCLSRAAGSACDADHPDGLAERFPWLSQHCGGSGDCGLVRRHGPAGTLACAHGPDRGALRCGALAAVCALFTGHRRQRHGLVLTHHLWRPLCFWHCGAGGVAVHPDWRAGGPVGRLPGRLDRRGAAAQHGLAARVPFDHSGADHRGGHRAIHHQRDPGHRSAGRTDFCARGAR